LYVSHISLNTEAASLSETSVTQHQSTRSDIPEDCMISQGKPCVFPSLWSFHQCLFLTASEISDKPTHHHDVGFLIRSLSNIGHNAVKLTRLLLPCICPFQRLAYVRRRRVSKSDIDFVQKITITRDRAVIYRPGQALKDLGGW